MEVKKPSICHIVTAFPRHEGDVITPWLVRLLEEESRDFDVSVFVSSYKGLGSSIYKGIKIKRFRYFLKGLEDLTHDETTPDRIKSKPWYIIHLFFYLILGGLSLYRYAKREAFDIVQIHWPMPHALWGFIIRLASRRTRIFHRYYGAEVRWMSHSFPFVKPLFRMMLSRIDGASANSSVTARAVFEILSREVAYIPDGVPFDVNPSPKEEGTEVLFVGRLVERKGVDVLIKAANLLKDRAFTFSIVGRGAEEERLECMVSNLGLNDKVIFHKTLRGEELKTRYEACFVFVLPAVIDSKGDTEGLGVVLLEALAEGRAVIGSNIGGITDIIKHEVTGLLVPSNDELALAEAIERLWLDKSLRERLVEGGRRHLSKAFSWGAIIEGYKRLYGIV